MLALEIARHQSSSHYDSKLRARSRVHAEEQRQPHEDEAATETAAAASTPQDRPTFAPLLETPQTTAARAEPSAAHCIPNPGTGRSGMASVNAPSPGQALPSQASEDYGSGNRNPMSEGPLRHATTQSVNFHPQTQGIQYANSHHQHAKAPCAALPSNRCGTLHSGIGCPGPLESHQTPPFVHALRTPFNKPRDMWQDLLPGLIPRNLSMNIVGNAPCASDSFALPLRIMTVEAPGQDHARVHGGTIPTRGLPAGIGAGHAQQNASIAQSALGNPQVHQTGRRPGHAQHSAGIAQGAQVNTQDLHAGTGTGNAEQNASIVQIAHAQGAQENKDKPPHDQGHLLDVSSEEFQFCEQRSMQVLPYAWQHHVPEAFEAQFAEGQAQHLWGAAVFDEPPANAQPM